MGIQQYLKYNEDWKKNPTKDRAVKFLLNDTIKFDNTTINEYITKKSNEIGSILWNGLLDKSITLEEIHDVRVYADKIIKNNPQLDINSSSWSRCLARPVLERYKSGIERNGKLAKRKIKFRLDKAVRIYDNIFKLKDNKLYFKTPSGDSININYKVAGTMNKYLPYVSKAMGGNLINNMYIARAKVPIIWQYEPIDVIGTDINKRPDVFLVLSNGIIYPHSPELKLIVKEMISLNKEISNTNKNNGLNTKQRKRRRVRIQKLHKKQNKIINEICVKPLLEYVKLNKLLLAIDDARTGVKNGSYGQDKIISNLLREAENQGVPHVLVQPSQTSKLCCKCESWTERPEVNKIICPTCGDIDADLNGAKNVAKFGLKIWNEGISAFWSWKKTLKPQVLSPVKQIG